MLWQFHSPTSVQTDRLLRQQELLAFSYEEVGATRGEFPRGFVHDRNEIILGHGLADFEWAVEGLRMWKMFPSEWSRLDPLDAPQVTGTVVALTFRLAGIYWRSTARIVYEVNETNTPDVQRRCGFAYGTLPGHVECGEECFTIALRHDGAVVYELRAFSRPRFWMARLANSLARRWQRKFVRDSQQALLQHVRAEN